MHEVLVNRLGGLSLPRKSVVRLTDRPDMTLDVYRGRKTTMQQQQILVLYKRLSFSIASSRRGSGSRDPPISKAQHMKGGVHPCLFAALSFPL